MASVESLVSDVMQLDSEIMLMVFAAIAIAVLICARFVVSRRNEELDLAQLHPLHMQRQQNAHSRLML